MLARPEFDLLRRFALWCLFGASLIVGLPTVVAAREEFLDPELAFTLSGRAIDDHRIELLFTAAPGYYLYRDRFEFRAEGATLGEPTFPHGKVKFDETFQKNVETFRGEVPITIPVGQAPAGFTLLVVSQGCADKGLCYPPAERAVHVRLTAFGGNGSVEVLNAAQTASQSTASGGRSGPDALASGTLNAPAAAAGLDAVLRAGRFWSVVAVFFVAGVLLSLTPCVLPMLPILSSIIVGHGSAVSRSRGFGLALSYSLGMALVYTALGIAAGLAGEGLAAMLQNGWVLGGFALLLVLLSLSMFGVYELRLPGSLTGRLSRASQRLGSGRVAAVFAMGGVSALIVSPCVVAPLAGALLYLSQTRDVWLGGTALFSLAAGMSVPLLLIGASAGALLPRTGAWMDEVKRFFGMVLLGVALWTVQTVLPAPLVLALWGVLALVLALVVLRPGRDRAGRTRSPWRRGAAAVFALAGLLQLVGAASGSSDPLQPLDRLSGMVGRNRGGAASPADLSQAFQPVRSVEELDAILRADARPAMLDFYADWCVSCKEMERFTFADPRVRRQLAGALRLRADVTANNLQDRALMRRFGLYGPPGLVFFDTQGREVSEVRVIGFQDADRFLQSLARAGL